MLRICGPSQPLTLNPQPFNYSPISLTSVLSKVFESTLNNKIWKHHNSSNLISDRQYGFRKERSTGNLLFLLFES